MITLRALEPEDLDALYEMENDRSNWEVGITNVPFSRYALREYIARNSYDIYADKQLRQVITDESNTLLGVVDLFDFDPRNLRAEVSVCLLSQHRGKGIATQALLYAQQYSATILHLNQLYAFVAEDNVRSIHLFERAGYEKTSELKSWIIDGDTTKNAYIFQLMLK